MIALSKLNKSFFILLLITLAGMQVSCGFHLRGAIELPEYIKPIFIDLSVSDNEVRHELKKLLSSAEGVLVESIAEAKTVLQISAIQTKQRVVAVDNLGRAREYELNYQFTYELKKVSKNSSVLETIKVSTIKLKRDLLFDPENVLAVEHEKKAMYENVRKDAATIMLRQLSAIKLPDFNQPKSENTYWF